MADSESRLFVSLILFWTFLTIFSYVFSGYLEGQAIGTDVTEFTKEMDSNVELSGWENFILNVYNSLDQIPVINVFVPLIKIMTFEYSDIIHPVISMFLQATLLFTYYVIWGAIKK